MNYNPTGVSIGMVNLQQDSLCDAIPGHNQDKLKINHDQHSSGRVYDHGFGYPQHVRFKCFACGHVTTLGFSYHSNYLQTGEYNYTIYHPRGWIARQHPLGMLYFCPDCIDYAQDYE